MNQLILKFKSIFISKDFMKFLLIGIINTFNGTLFSTLYGLVIDANIAFIMGYITSLCIAYLLNSKFIFYKKTSINGLIKFK